jgi:purine-binding chemotaxis protein CheW
MADFSTRLLLFRVADIVAAVEAATVREILSPQAATRIPGAPAAVQGLINVRGELVTLVRGRELLGREGDDGDAGTVILLRWEDRGVAVVVDEVVDLVPAGTLAITPRDELPGVDPALVRAVALHDEHSILLLDLDALFRPLLAA